MKRHLHLWAALAALILCGCSSAPETFTSGPGWLEFPAGKGAGAPRRPRLLEGLAATGLRSIRYALEVRRVCVWGGGD